MDSGKHEVLNVPVVVWPTSEVKDYSEDDEANDGQDLDRADSVIEL
jgi:hypothetical protein